jgi:opacity protein-like surface antigen
MKLAAVGAASLLLLLAAAATAGAVTFEVINNATTTPGGQRFDRDYGVSYAAQVLSDASCFIWAVFNQKSPADRRPVDHVTLVVNAVDGIAYTAGSTIVLNAGYVNNYTGDVKTEVRLPSVHTRARVYVALFCS